MARQLEHKFGPLDSTVTARLDRADLDTLRAWSECLLDASTLEEVWADSPDSYDSTRGG